MKVASVAERGCEQAWKRPELSRVLRRIALGIALSALAGVVVLFMVLRGRRVEVTEGLTLHWLGITEGTNSFVQGNPLEKLLGDRIPAKGIHFGALKLNRPVSYRSAERDAPLTAWIMASGPRLQEMQFLLQHGFKVVTANSAGRELELPPATPYRIASNEVLFTISLYAFPRDERTVQLRIAPPLDNKQERRWAEFDFKNPFRGEHEQWQAEPLPVTNGVGGNRFVLSHVFLRPTRLTFQTPSKGWYLSECTMWDEEGNRSAMSSAGYQEREVAVGFSYPLENDRTWKVAAIFTRAPPYHRLLEARQFTPEDRFRVQVDTRATYVSTTNSEGTVYRWRLDAQKLSVWNATDPMKKPQFALVSASNELGRAVTFLDTGWMSRGSNVTQVWSTGERPSAMSVELGIGRTVNMEFYVRPDGARRK